MVGILVATFGLLMTPLDSLPDASGITWVVQDTVKPSHHPIKAVFNLDSRSSFIERQPVNIWGVNAGIAFGAKRNQLTLGYYWMSYAAYAKLINWRKEAAHRINLSYYTRTDLWFTSLLYWWNLKNSQRWMISLPMEVGAGLAYAIPHDLSRDQPIDRTTRHFFAPVQIGMYVQWKATRWVGFGLQGGYRYSVFQTDLDQHFNGTYYSVGMTIYPTLLKDSWRFLKYKERISPFHPPRPRKN